MNKKERYERMRNENRISFKLSGRYALFSDPVTRVGGEKSSYFVPTYQALKGITESIYWKPTIIWKIDRVGIISPFRTQSKGIRPIKYSGGNDLSIYTYLRDVEYVVDAHFEWNMNREDLAFDRNEDKHFQIAKRMVERGGRRDIFLGTRECQGYIEPCNFEEEMKESVYINIDEMAFGIMFHSFSYPDENGEDMLRARFWSPVMKRGIIEFIQPEECSLVRDITEMKAKIFVPGENFSGIDTLAEEEGIT